MKFSKLEYLIIFLSAVLVIIIGFYFITKDNTIKQQITQLQQELQQLEERKKQIEQVDIDRLAEDISNILLGTYISTSTDIEVEGVEIIDKGDRKLVINHQEGYQIEIPKNLILNQSKRASALHFDDPEMIKVTPRTWQWTVIMIFVFDKNDPKDDYAFRDLEITTTTIMNDNTMYGTTTQVTIPSEIQINGKQIKKLCYYTEYPEKYLTLEEFFEKRPLELGPDHCKYLILKNNKLYDIFAPEWFEKDYLKTFKFLEE